MDSTGTQVRPSSRLVVREEHDGRVARLVLSNPPDNAIDIMMAAELNVSLDALAKWPNLAAVIVEGDGLHFSSGLSPSHRRPPYGDELLRSYLTALRKLASLEALVVGCVRGRCAGAGLELAMLSHVLLCDATAKFSLPDVNLGGFALVAPLLLPERIGRTRADEWMISGRVVDSTEALQVGLVSACPGGWENLDGVAERQIEQFVLLRPVESVRALARSISLPRVEALERDLPELERLFEQRVSQTPEFAEGLSAALRHRTPSWAQPK